MRGLFIGESEFEKRWHGPGRAQKLKTGGQDALAYPIGTVIAGKPAGEAMRPLFTPDGLLRSPMSRGGLLQLGYTIASNL
jgi:hypothetical protein